jgi:hypothetical protein
MDAVPSNAIPVWAAVRRPGVTVFDPRWADSNLAAAILTDAGVVRAGTVVDVVGETVALLARNITVVSIVISRWVRRQPVGTV